MRHKSQAEVPSKDAIRQHDADKGEACISHVRCLRNAFPMYKNEVGRTKVSNGVEKLQTLWRLFPVFFRQPTERLLSFPGIRIHG